MGKTYTKGANGFLMESEVVTQTTQYSVAELQRLLAATNATIAAATAEKQRLEALVQQTKDLGTT